MISVCFHGFTREFFLFSTQFLTVFPGNSKHETWRGSEWRIRGVKRLSLNYWAKYSLCLKWRFVIATQYSDSVNSENILSEQQSAMISNTKYNLLLETFESLRVLMMYLIVKSLPVQTVFVAYLKLNTFLRRTGVNLLGVE